MDLSRLCRRFEIAVGNFGRSCIGMRANEKAFQAWYAACVIQEFGLARVYREVHFTKADLFELAGRHPFTTGLEAGHELFPDLSVSWQPDVDARHSSTRNQSVRHASSMLGQFGILSELKVTGSTGTPTSRKQLRQDLAKLAVFRSAHAAAIASGKAQSDIATYMVVLDNFCDDGGIAKPHYDEHRMEELLEPIRAEWPESIPKPPILLLFPDGDASVMKVYRDFAGVRIDVVKGSRS